MIVYMTSYDIKTILEEPKTDANLSHCPAGDKATNKKFKSNIYENIYDNDNEKNFCSFIHSILLTHNNNNNLKIKKINSRPNYNMRVLKIIKNKDYFKFRLSNWKEALNIYIFNSFILFNEDLKNKNDISFNFIPLEKNIYDTIFLMINNLNKCNHKTKNDEQKENSTASEEEQPAQKPNKKNKKIICDVCKNEII